MDTLDISLNQNPDKDFVKNLEFWMTNLPHTLRTTPIIHLAIPGSHDSATYGITDDSKISPDAEKIIQSLQFLGPVLRKIMVKWSKTQSAPVTTQLQCGVRYFDLRIAKNDEDGQLYFVHGLYSNEVSEVFEEFKSFFETHPKEVVLLDCQHFYAFQQSDHERLMHLITSTFGHKLLPYMQHMEHITLQYMTSESRYQVIVMYRSNAARFGQPLLWPSACFPTPWADTVSISTLISFLAEKIKSRSPERGFISQCILTPTPWFIIKHLFSSLKKQCFLPLQKPKYNWLENQRPGRNGLNIVISDFVDYEDGMFSRAVIDLNRKLLSDGGLERLTPIE